MTTYAIQAPDGNTYHIDGPPGATDDQVRAEVVRQNPNLGASTTPTQQPHASIGNIAMAPLQLGMSAFSHGIEQPFLEGAAGLAARLTNSDPAAAHAWADSKVYNTPEGSVARGITDQMHSSIAPIADTVGGYINSADSFIGKYAGPETQKIVRQTLGTASDIAGVVPGVGVVAKGLKDMAAASRPVAEAAQVARAPDELAKAAGIRIPPSIQEGTTGATPPTHLQTTLEAIGGRSIIKRADIIQAKKQVNDMVRTANNIPTDRLLGEAAYAEAEKPFIATYREADAAIPQPIAIDGTTQAEMANAGKRKDSLRPVPASVEKARQDAKAITEGNGAQLRSTIADYREKGYTALRSDDPDIQAFGHAQLDIANALEGQMKRELNRVNPGLAARFDIARQGFAKINDARAATVGNDIDPQMLRKIAEGNRGVDGEYRLIADLAARYPKILTNNVPTKTSVFIGHMIGPGIAGSLGYHFGGASGMAAGLAGMSMAQMGSRALLNRVLPVAENSRIALGTALADYAGKKAVGGFNPSQGDKFIPAGPKGGIVATVPGRDYNPQIPARGPSTPRPNEGLNPSDQALADALINRHPSAARPAPLRLPAPGQLAVRDAVPSEVRPSVAKQHPGAGNNPVPSTVTAKAQKDKIDHLIWVLSHRKNANVNFNGPRE